MPDIKYEVVEKIGIVAEGSNGWNKELNLSAGTRESPFLISVSGLPITRKWERALLSLSRKLRLFAKCSIISSLTNILRR